MPRDESRAFTAAQREDHQLRGFGRPQITGLRRGPGGRRGRGGARVETTPTGDQSAVDIHHVTLLAQSGQTITAGGGQLVSDRIAGAPTEIRGFPTLRKRLAEDGSVAAIPLPLTGVYDLKLLGLWASYRAGGDITVTLTRHDAVRGVWTVEGGPITSRLFKEEILGQIEANAGDLLTVALPNSSEAAETLSWCRLQLRGIGLASATSSAERFVETMEVDSRLHYSSGGHAESTAVLESGVRYRVEAVGNFTIYGSDATTGQSGDADAILFPSPGGSGTFAGDDAESTYAGASADGPYPVHTGKLTFDTQDGSGFVHVESNGGPYTSPLSDHTYSFVVTGAGATLRARIGDPVAGDNNGIINLAIYRQG